MIKDVIIKVPDNGDEEIGCVLLCFNALSQLNLNKQSKLRILNYLLDRIEKEDDPLDYLKRPS